MEKTQVNLLKEKYNLNGSPAKPFLYFGRIILAVTIFLAAAGGIFSYDVASSNDGQVGFPKFSFFSTVRQIIGADDRLLKGEKEDRVNLLILGIGGQGHDGPQLTDTMIFTGWQPSTNAVGMISIPRDLIVPISDYGWRKINHANAFGEQEEAGRGPQLASEVVSEIFDQPVDYYLRIDFD